MGANCINESQCDEIAERSLNQQIDEYLEMEEEDIIIINKVKYKKVEGFECSKCDLKRDDCFGFCVGYVSCCGNFHYERIVE